MREQPWCRDPADVYLGSHGKIKSIIEYNGGEKSEILILLQYCEKLYNCTSSGM